MCVTASHLIFPASKLHCIHVASWPGNISGRNHPGAGISPRSSRAGHIGVMAEEYQGIQQRGCRKHAAGWYCPCRCSSCDGRAKNLEEGVQGETDGSSVWLEHGWNLSCGAICCLRLTATPNVLLWRRGIPYLSRRELAYGRIAHRAGHFDMGLYIEPIPMTLSCIPRVSLFIRSRASVPSVCEMRSPDWCTNRREILQVL